MSFPEDVKKVLRRALEKSPKALPDTPENREANKALLLVTLTESVHALKEAILLVTYEIETLRAAIEERDDPSRSD